MDFERNHSSKNLNDFRNAILTCHCSQIFHLCHTFKGFASYLHTLYRIVFIS
jgi:hypothetical protein